MIRERSSVIMRGASFVPLLALVAGCIGDLPSRPCALDEQCLQAGVRGVCTPSPLSSESFCVFPADECERGRWGLLAGDGLSAACLGEHPDATFDSPVVDGAVSGVDAAMPPDAPITPDALVVDAGIADARTTGLVQWSVLGGGSVRADGTYPSCGTNCVEVPLGSMVTLRAAADARYRFSQWRGVSCTTQAVCTFVVDADKPVLARFEGGVPVHSRGLRDNVGAGVVIAAEPSGAYAVAGSFASATDFGDGILVNPSVAGRNFVIKYRPNHTVLWKKFFAGTASIHDLAIEPDGGVVAVGSFKGSVDFGPGDAVSSDDPSFTDLFVVSYSPSGADRWVQTFTTDVGKDASAADVDVSATGAFAIIGYFGTMLRFNDNIILSSAAGEQSQFVAGFSPGGDVTWAKVLPRSSGPIVNAGSVDPAGNVLVGWSFEGELQFAGRTYTSSQTDAIALRYSPSGGELWAYHHSNSGHASRARATYDPFGGIVVGFSFNTPLRLGTDPLYTPQGSDVALVRFSAGGTYQRSIILGGGGDQAVSELRVGADGDTFVKTAGVTVIEGWLLPSALDHIIKFGSDDAFAWAAPTMLSPGVLVADWLTPGAGGTVFFVEIDLLATESPRWIQLSE